MVANMTAVSKSLIVLDEQGRAWIEGANTKVIEVAKDRVAHGWSPEEMHFMHPRLSLAQIYVALSYYHEHKGEFDAEIRKSAAEIEKMRLAQGETPLKKRLREMGILK
jgi:uncharacterized protein (DUF433 family)